MARGGLTILAGLTILTMALLSACTNGGADDARPSDEADEPRPDVTPSAVETPGLSLAQGPYQVGDCWQEADYVVASDWSSWQGAPAVDCGDAHNTITYNVAELPDDFPYPVDATGQAADLSDDAVATVNAACGEAAEALGVSGRLPHLNRLMEFWYLPSPEQWADGERFVRCDVGLRAFSTTHADKALAPLDDTLVTLAARISGYPGGFEMCYLDAEGADQPRLFVTCSGEYSWRWFEDYEPTSYVGGPYPGEAALEESVQERCESLVLGDGPTYSCWAEVPSEADWASGDLTISLWTTKIG